MSEITFAALPLVAPLQRSLRENGYERPSAIQAQAIPHLLEGRDLIGCAQTGTGKTAAFALPILQLLAASGDRPRHREVRALILVPTRELAVQVEKSFATYGSNLRLSRALVYGGVSAGPQIKALRAGVDVLVATPGRFLDLYGQGHMDLSRVRHLVLDEVDQMLDMGFLPDVRRICKELPANRQSLFFSATLAPAMKQLALSIVRDPVTIAIAPEAPVVEKIHQQVCFIENSAKRDLLEQLVNEQRERSLESRTLVFSRTKHGANKIAKLLDRVGLRAEAIHGNKSQSARQRALESFRDGRIPVLVATDVAARGIDVKGITLVVNYDLPETAEVYVHRIGRTARAESDGRAVSFCSEGDQDLLFEIQKLTRRSLEVWAEHPYHAPAIASNASERGHPSSRSSRRTTGRSRPAGRSHRHAGNHTRGNRNSRSRI